MSELTSETRAAPADGGGKPPEIELWSNRRVIHPISRWLVTRLIPTGISPNQVSCLSVVTCALAAAAYRLVPWPFGAAAGFALHVGWHVLDGADGDLARRTGRSSPSGEIVDGLCDYLSHLILYATLAVMLSAQIGGWAWPVAAASGLARAIQANSYESRRRTYQYWMQGGAWLKQTLASDAAAGGKRMSGVLRRFGGAYLAVSERISSQAPGLDAALRSRAHGGPEALAAMRTLYREHQAHALRSSFPLSSNARTVALFASMLAGSPLYFFCYEVIGLSLVLIATLIQQRRCDAALLSALAQGSRQSAPGRLSV